MPPKVPTLLSRKSIVPWIAVCLLVSAVAIPLAAHLPRWTETEIVFGAWWVIWLATLSYLLFQGHAVDDDTDVHFFQHWPKNLGPGGEAAADATAEGGGCLLDSAGCADSSGCAEIVLYIAGTILALVAIWLFVELLIPAIALLLLASIGGMLARAVNDHHHCKGRFGPSLLWGALWATLYIGPIAAAAIWISVFISHRSGL